MPRLAAYAGASTVAAACVVLWAFNQRSNFYSACVYLAQSNLCLMILTNLILLITCTFFYALQRLFYGPLRPIEIEQLYEKAWFAITETCLAMTIFREEVGAWFLVMFVALLAGKVWGWIGDGRVEILEQQPPANPRLFHARLMSSLALSLLYDASVMSYTINTVIQQARPNMMVMFLFEFAILTTCSFSTALRYMISLIETKITKQQTQERLAERRREVREAREAAIRQREADASASEDANSQPPIDLPEEEDVDEMDIEVSGWEAKGQWILTLDLLTDLFKLAIYSIFFFILLTFYGLPIHIMRDLFLTARSFIKRLTAFLRYRRATQDMNRRYPDATVEDIAREDTCIICREEMRPWSETNPPNPPRDAAAPRASPANERSRPKKLPCGHILHLGCLKSWLERQQVCPTCRNPVVENPRQTANRPNNQANGQPDAAAPHDQHQPGAAQPPAAPRPNGGMRMINFGPIRVGFGHGNVQDMAQQIGAQPRNQGARMFGLELGFPRNRRQQQQPQAANSPAPATQVQGQLLLIEQQIMQQIRALQVTQQELQLVQLLQSELTRLRNLQNGTLNPGSGIPGINGAPPPMFAPQPVLYPTVVQRHAVLPGTSSIPAGSPDLPSGVAIPEGWSLLPLQRLDPSGANTPGAMNVSRQSSTILTPPSVSTPSAAPATGAAGPTSNLSNEVFTASSNAPPQEINTATPPNGSSAPHEIPVPDHQISSLDGRTQLRTLDNTSDGTYAINPTAHIGSLNVEPTAQAATNGPSSLSNIVQPTGTIAETPQPSVSNANQSQNGNEESGPVGENGIETGDVEGTEEERRQAKGKARAVTIEDSPDDDA